MKTEKKDDKKPTDEPGKDEDNAVSLGELNNPKVDEKTGKPTQKAISSFKQAHSIAKRHYDKAKDGRLKTAAVIADKYGGSAPYKIADLARTGQLWRNNFSTNPLGSTVDRSTTQFTDPIKKAEFLTYSALKPNRPDAAEKTRKFRTRTTKLIRTWPGWVSFVGQVVQDEYLYGNSAPGWLDDDWRPKAFGYDETFLPEGTGQHSSMGQFIIYRQPILLHDFLKKLSDEETAKDAGYNWEGCVKAANEAAGLRNDGDLNQLEQSDQMRENGALGFTYQGELKVIWLFHVLVREYDGGVDLWTVTDKGAHGVRYVKGLHEEMEDASTFFTIQEGNKKFYGSKGAGRLLTNLHISLDRGRNLGQDQVYLGGLPIMKVDKAKMNEVQPTVRHPFILVPKDVEIVKEGVEFNWEGFQWMDDKLTRIMSDIAGAFIPVDMSSADSGATTKIEAAENAARQLAVKNGVLGRFFGQFAFLIGGMQRKIFKPENLKEGLRIFEENKTKREKGITVLAKKVWKWLKEVFGEEAKQTIEPQEQSSIADPEAVEAIVDLLEDGLSVEELVELALCPAGNNVEEEPELEDQKTVAFIQTKQGHPMFDQKAMARMEAEITIGADRAQQILLPDQEDPNDAAVARRQQILEWMAMVDKEAMPVASTDNHAVHRQTMLEKLPPIMQALTMAPEPEMLSFAGMAVQHYGEHVVADPELDENQRAQEAAVVEGWQQILTNAQKEVEKLAKQAAEAGVAGGPGALPPSVPGQPLMAGGPNGSMPGTEGELERQRLLAEDSHKNADRDLKHRELDLREQELDHKIQKDAADLAVGVAKDVASKQEAAIKQGIADADKERQAENDRQNPAPPKA